MPDKKKKAQELDKKKKAQELMKSSYEKKIAAAQQEALGKAQIKNKVKPGQTGTSKYKENLGEPFPVGKQRLEIAKKLRLEATKDSLAAVKMYPPITPKKIAFKKKTKPVVTKKPVAVKKKTLIR